MTNYYVDTSIWRDYWENRRDKLRPLGDFAFEFLKKVMTEKHKIIYSQALVDELLIVFTEKEIEERFFKDLRSLNLLVKTKITEKETKEAIKLSKERKVPRKDALHAVIARNNNCIFVARDHHFDELQDIVKTKKPEEII